MSEATKNNPDETTIEENSQGGWYEDPSSGVKTDGNGNYLIEDYQTDWYMIMGK